LLSPTPQPEPAIAAVPNSGIESGAGVPESDAQSNGWGLGIPGVTAPDESEGIVRQTVFPDEASEENLGALEHARPVVES
jgi:hypothetical protein